MSNILSCYIGGFLKYLGLGHSASISYLSHESNNSNSEYSDPVKGRPGAVVRAVSLSHQVVGSKQPLRRFCGGKACLGLSLPQTPLMWEPPALGLPFLCDVLGINFA